MEFKSHQIRSDRVKSLHGSRITIHGHVQGDPVIEVGKGRSLYLYRVKTNNVYVVCLYVRYSNVLNKR